MTSQLIDQDPALPGLQSPACPFVVVTGGKGGVGKTTVAANLGVSLAKGRALGDPLLVDLDFALANLDVVLGLRPERNLGDFFSRTHGIEECLHEGPSGLKILPAASGSLEWARPDQARRQRLIEALVDHSPSCGVLVGDSAAGIGPDVLDFALLADRVLVVTTPDPAAVTDAYGVIKALDALSRERECELPTPQVFVNLAGDAAQAREVALRLGEVCQRFLARSPQLIGWMPSSRALRRAAALQRPVVESDPRCSASQAIDRLAARLGRSLGLSTARPLKGQESHGR